MSAVKMGRERTQSEKKMDSEETDEDLPKIPMMRILKRNKLSTAKGRCARLIKCKNETKEQKLKFYFSFDLKQFSGKLNSTSYQ